MEETYVCGICWNEKGKRVELTKEEMERHVKEEHPDTEISETPINVTYIKEKGKWAS